MLGFFCIDGAYLLFYVCTVFDFSDGVSMALSVTALFCSTSSTALCLSTVSVPYVRLLR